jgi:sn-glycerol 3-phosphate transport system substrate-binding protein
VRKLLAVLLLVLPALSLTAQDEIEIVFTHTFGEVAEGEDITDVRIAVIEEIVDAFEAQNPGVRIITRSPGGYQQVFDNALAAASQGDAPHIVQVEEGFTQLAIDSQLFVPVSEVATEEQMASLDDLLPQVAAYYRLEEGVWGLPWNASNPVLYYNRDMFEQAGLDPDQPPRTFADVTAYCETIMSELELQACINWPMITWFPEQWVAMQNELVFNNDNGRSARASEAFYDSEAMVGALEWWKELKDLGYFTYTATRDNYTGEAGLFLTRQTAMTLTSSAGVSNFVSLAERFNLNLQVSPLPLPNEDATNGVTVGGGSVWLTVGHSEAEQQAAIDFMFFLISQENDMKWHKGSGYYPVRTSSVEQLREEGWFEENPFFAVAVDQLEASAINTATAGGVIGPSAQVRDYLLSAFESVINGGEDPAAALAVAKERADEELQAYNSLFE